MLTVLSGLATGLVILAAFVNVVAVALLLCILKCFKAAVCMFLFFEDVITIEQCRHPVQKFFEDEIMLSYCQNDQSE